MMRRLRDPLRHLRPWPVLVAVALAFGSAAAATPTAAAAPTFRSAAGSSNDAACAWTVVPTPSPVGDSILRGVSAPSASDAWAVGDTSNNGFQPLIEHWNGRAWSLTPAPAVAGGNLYAVAERTSTDAWAVGETFSSSGGSATLIERWNGTSWTIVPSPNMGTAYNALNAVAALSATNAWAVGNESNDPSNSASATLVEHWNGSTWSVVPSPNVGTSSQMFGIAAVSANNLWAVGVSASTANAALIEHWNGSKWSAVGSPGINGTLNAVTGLTASNLWAAGNYYNTTLATEQTLVEHWNGAKWTVVPSPNATTPDLPVANRLLGVAAVSASNVWAVGWVNWDPTGDQYHTLFEHWNGTAWHLVTGPSVPKSTNDALFGITRVPGTTHLWAVGYATPSGNGTPMQPLAEYRC